MPDVYIGGHWSNIEYGYKYLLLKEKCQPAFSFLAFKDQFLNQIQHDKFE